MAFVREYTAKMKPKKWGDTPLLRASWGKKGAMLEYTEFVRKFMNTANTMTQSN